MNKWQRFLGQAACYALFMLLLGVLSNSPPYAQLAPDQATIKISLRHAGKLLGECRQLSGEELANLPPTMRATQSCPRERSPLLLELDVNDQTVLSDRLEPGGLSGDGKAAYYRRLNIAAGKVHLRVRLKDDIRQPTFPYQVEREIELSPAQVLAIDFDATQLHFVFL